MRTAWGFLALLLLAPTLVAAAEHDMAHMEMDGGYYGKVGIDQAEWRSADLAAWNAQAWFGGDYHKIWLKSEGQRGGGREDARVELLWDRVVSPWWHLQAGVREDWGGGAGRSWAAVGIAGMAPQFLGVEATLYLGDAGRSAARLKLEYEVLLTQRWILQPEAEANLYGRADPERGLESGLAEFEAGLRLRYEIRRRFAPYLGVLYGRRHGVQETRAVAGLRIWF